MLWNILCHLSKFHHTFSTLLSLLHTSVSEALTLNFKVSTDNYGDEYMCIYTQLFVAFCDSIIIWYNCMCCVIFTFTSVYLNVWSAVFFIISFQTFSQSSKRTDQASLCTCLGFNEFTNLTRSDHDWHRHSCTSFLYQRLSCHFLAYNTTIMTILYQLRWRCFHILKGCADKIKLVPMEQSEYIIVV